MTTERMTELDKALGSLGFTHDVSAARNELATLRRVEQEQAAEIAIMKQSQEAQKHVIAELREQLRLAHDKMQHMVRQARLELLEDVMGRAPAVANSVERLARFWEWLNKAYDANAPKD